MKNLITVIALCLSASIFGQSLNLKGEVKDNDVKVENVKIEVEVDSIEEIESTFTIEDFKQLLDETTEGEDLTFKIKCNGKKMSNGLKSSMSYEIKGNTSDKETFLENVTKLRKAAIKYYQSKNK
ncbi:hypothetical protein [Winogradskyella haliclonae]|uniref:Uncharacterized protein n=1 Tax=Winogradskyella haliclonae TaxID=2048558 RepID=A0ABQ2BTK3_9FLAO|nr:hypothetical protein [Winogradskyella haliclonae]GGI55802.1 hypothetical protein GCM10011444_01110 [Winogradskyella haliclonae]